jgi:hypothetical protein
MPVEREHAVANWFTCDVEVSHHDPKAIDRVAAAASPDWRYLVREFCPDDEGAKRSVESEPGAMPHLDTRVERVRDGLVRLHFLSKYEAPLHLFDAMLAAGYGVRGELEDDCDCGHIWTTHRYDNGVVTKHHCDLNELQAIDEAMTPAAVDGLTRLMLHHDDCEIRHMASQILLSFGVDPKDDVRLTRDTAFALDSLMAFCSGDDIRGMACAIHTRVQHEQEQPVTEAAE